jgi:hypothetical protein
MTTPPRNDRTGATADAELDQALGQLPELALDPQRSAVLLRSAQRALASAAPQDPAWLRWYERRLEPALLTLACAFYLSWAFAAASPPAILGPAEPPPAQANAPAPPTAQKWRGEPNQRADSARQVKKTIAKPSQPMMNHRVFWQHDLARLLQQTGATEVHYEDHTPKPTTARCPGPGVCQPVGSSG